MGKLDKIKEELSDIRKEIFLLKYKNEISIGDTVAIATGHDDGRIVSGEYVVIGIKIGERPKKGYWSKYDFEYEVVTKDYKHRWFISFTTNYDIVKIQQKKNNKKQ